MKNIVKLFAINFLVVITLLLLIETVCYLLLPAGQMDRGFFLRLHGEPFTIPNPADGYDLIDPLLGYAKTETKLVAEGFKVESGCIVLTTSEDTAGRIKIFITGGSTSDLSYYNNKCWPLALRDILQRHGIKAKIYCGGTAGYNSGQELLKLIRDGVPNNPTIHISYTGANELIHPTYISFYEKSIYEKEFDPENSVKLMPNTVIYLRRLLGLNHNAVTLRGDYLMPPDKFLEINLRVMHGISTDYNYRFISFLQPVLGSGKYNHPVKGYENMVDRYKKLYPSLKEASARHPEFIVDLTNTFDTCTGEVYRDQCHVYDEYQPLIAENIFNALVARDLLPK